MPFNSARNNFFFFFKRHPLPPFLQVIIFAKYIFFYAFQWSNQLLKLRKKIAELWTLQCLILVVNHYCQYFCITRTFHSIRTHINFISIIGYFKIINKSSVSLCLYRPTHKNRNVNTEYYIIILILLIFHREF